MEPSLLFLGTEFGLYFSPDAGRRWIHLKKTLPTASVMDMVIHPRDHDLVIGTHGRALWVLDDIRPLRGMSEQALKAPLTLYPIGDAYHYWSRGEEGGFGFGASEFRGTSRPYGAILTYSMNLPELPLPDEEQERTRREKERHARATSEEERATPARPEKSETPRVAETAEAQREQRRGEAAEPDTADEKPRVEITVTDSTGQVIRRFKAPAVQGVNRAAWDLKRDAFRQPPRAEDAPPAPEDPAGPEVPPGTYTVTMTYGTHEGRQQVRVAPDPRSQHTEQDWRRRNEAIVRLGAANDAAVEAIWRLRRTRSDAAMVQDRIRQRARDAGERDSGKIDNHPVIAAGKTLTERLDALEKRLWVSPETVGIVADTDVYSKVSWAGWYFGSSMDVPNANQLEHLRQGEVALTAFLEEFNAFLASDVAAFQNQAAEVAVVGDTTPISIKR